MAIRQIRLTNDPILRKKCREIEQVDGHIRLLLDDMLDTLHHTDNGAAIAANQIGILKRLVVIDMNGQLMKLVNPVIIKQEGRQECVEGCLSVPGRFGKTHRPNSVTVTALNENGEPITVSGTGEMAKCLCHEIDHLDGILFIDKVMEWV